MSTKSYRHCPGIEHEISIFICRGRQKAHYPKCSECEYRTTTEEISPIPAKEEKKISQPPVTLPKTGSIMVKSEPPSAVIFLDDDNIGVTPAIITQIRPGKYKIKIKMDEYNLWSQGVDVKANKETSITAVLQGQNCSVVIESKPTKAEIYIDGNNSGVTPVTIDSVKTGEHLVEVKLDGYETWSKQINVDTKRKTSLTAELTPKYGSISLSSEPTKAKIFLDGIEVGTTPASLRSVPHGDHLVKVKMDGYSVLEKNVNIEPGKEIVLTAKLQVNTGSVNIKSQPDNAKIYLDGKSVGTTPESIASMNPGIYEIKVEMENYDVWTETVNVEIGKENAITAVLQRSTGSIMVESKPTNAIIFVDGKKIGHTPEIVMSSAKGTHVIEVRMEGYDTWEKTLYIEPGAEKSITVNLQIKAGSLIINSDPSGGTVFLDEEEKGTTPADLKGIMFGAHRVEIKMDGYEIWSESVDISADKENKLSAVLQQYVGSINIKSKPANVTVIIDGKEVASTPADIDDLKPGKYHVELKKEGYGNWDESVEVNAGKDTHITAELQQLIGSINIKSEPSQAIVVVDGKEVGNSPANVTDLTLGKYLVEVKKEGYETWSKNVEIKMGMDVNLTATLKVKIGSFTIISVPEDAKAYIDDKEVGTTPLTISAPSPGKHSVEARMEGYEAWSRSIDFVQGKAITLTATLQIKSCTASITSEPSNAIVFIDSKEVGKTPIVITDPSPGNHAIDLKMDGYETWNKSIDFGKGKEIAITANLQMKAGSISISSDPSEAIIYLDGKKSGKTPEAITDLNPGTHLIEVRMDGYEEWSESVDIKADRENSLTAKLLKPTGSIDIKSNPPEATIYLDGERVGTTPDILKSVEIGAHEVEVKMEGFEEWKKTLKVKKGKEFALNVALQLNTGSVNIEGDPSEIRVLFDGNDVGMTPVNLTGIKIGIYDVELQKEGYVSCKKTLKVKAGRENSLTAKLIEMTGSVNINSKPLNATVCFGGKKIGKTPASITDLPAGNYQLEVKMDGYELWSDSVNINPGKESTVTAELQTKPGSVSINSEPPNAIVFIDKKEVGTTPKIITDLSNEKHLVEVIMDGYEAWSESVNVELGIELNIRAELQMIAGSVSINSEPMNAMILIDSKKAGATPTTPTDILPGKHNVEIRMEGYETWSKNVEIRSDKENTIEAVLQAITGSISIESNPSEATILLDGNDVSTTPDTISQVAIGIHEIEIKKEGYAEWKKKLNVKQGKEIILNAVLQPITGSARLESEPTGAVIFIDGENVGKTPDVITSISPGKHEIKIRLEGYDSCLQMVKIKNGKESLFSASLQRKKGSLMLISNPENALIYLEGKKYGRTPRTINELTPGNYAIELVLADYQTWSVKAGIVPGEEITIKAELQEKPGSISIKSRPSDAKIFIDGNEAGSTPETINDIECGTRIVKLVMEDYCEWSENVEVIPNKMSSLTAVLLEMAGSVSIKSSPSKAMITVDGNEVGTTPAIVGDLSPGKHIVNISRDGYNVWSQSVEIDAKKMTVISAILQETTGSITIKSIPADASIFIDGKKAGSAPETISDIKVGAHLVEVKRDGYENWSENIEITDKEYNLSATLQEKTGSINVQSEPLNATILISGNKIGLTPETIKNIKPGIHQIEIRADGFENWTNNVEVTAENTSKVTALLQKAVGSANVKSAPENAKIYIDGIEAGATPTTLSSIPIGAHEIEVKIDGHKDWKKSIIIKKEKELSLNAVLQINIGSINIESYPKNAKIYIDGKEVGITPKRFTDIVVGTHEVEVLLEGYLIWERTIKIKPEKETSLTADLEKVSGAVEIETDKTTKTPEIPKPITHKTPELKIKSEKTKEKPIKTSQKSKPSTGEKKTKHSPDKLIKLRSNYNKISGSKIESLPYIAINENNNNIYFCHSSINHRYELKPIGDGDVVIDHTTELMWHQAGSLEYFNYKKANKWLKKINKKSYAGFNDWRLPTLEEASSLLEFGAKSAKFIHTIFDEKQWGTWTGDRSDKGLVWIVTYVNGTISQVQAGNPATFVRPVRSLNI